MILLSLIPRSPPFGVSYSKKIESGDDSKKGLKRYYSSPYDFVYFLAFWLAQKTQLFHYSFFSSYFPYFQEGVDLSRLLVSQIHFLRLWMPLCYLNHIFPSTKSSKHSHHLQFLSVKNNSYLGKLSINLWRGLFVSTAQQYIR